MSYAAAAQPLESVLAALAKPATLAKQELNPSVRSNENLSSYVLQGQPDLSLLVVPTASHGSICHITSPHKS